jgi:RNA polymerase sigma-70 factor (ECF subfamily)
MEDLVLIRKCLAGRSEAFEPLIAKYKNLVYSIALNTLSDKNEAADVTQEVFLKAWANLSKYNPEFSFKTWIARITVNHCININQKNKRVVAWDDEEMGRVVSEEKGPEEAVLACEKRLMVRKAIESLPEMYRIMINLYHQENLSYEEICTITGNPMTIVKNRLYRARKMLAEKLREYTGKSLEKEEISWIAVKHGT